MTKIIKHLKFAIVFLSICIIFSSCVAAPQSINNSIEPELPSDEKTVNASSVEYGNIAAIRLQLETDLSKSYKNIKIKQARIGIGDVMPTYDVSIECNPDFDFKAMVDKIYSDKIEIKDEYFEAKAYGDPRSENYPAFPEPTYWEEEDAVLNINMMYYDWEGFEPSQDDLFYATYSKESLGVIWGSQTGYFSQGDKYYYQNFNIHERYRFDIDPPDKSISYKMSDGEEWNIYDAAEFVEDFWKNCLTDIDPEKYEYKVRTLYVMDYEDGSFGYLFDISRIDCDGNYYDCESNSVLDMDSVQNGQPFIVSNSHMTYCAEKNVVTRYIKDFSFRREKATDDGDNLLTLGAASKILSDSLASKINLELTAELNYIPVCKSYPYYSIWEEPLYHQEVCYATCDFEIKPYWCFRTDQCTFMGRNQLNLYLVDAVSGELITMTNGTIRRK